MRAFRRRRTWVKAVPFLAAALLASTAAGPGHKTPRRARSAGHRSIGYRRRSPSSPTSASEPIGRPMASESSSSMRWPETCGPTSSARSRSRKLTAHFEHAGFSRVHHLSNGDLILCGPVERDSESDDPEEGRFDGVLWVLRRPFDGVPVPLDEPCWEGIAAARHRLRVAWARSSIDYTAWGFVLQALFGPPSSGSATSSTSSARQPS